MLSRCKGKSPANYVRRIAIPASSSFHRAPLLKEVQENALEREEDEARNNVPGSAPIPTMKWRTLSCQRCRTALDSNLFSSSGFGQARKYTADTKQGEGSQTSPDEPESLFNSSKSAWDHVFENIDQLPPLESMPVTSLPRSTVYAPPGIVSPRRQAMTAREIAAFDNMFNMIFEAVQKQRSQTDATSPASATGRPRTAADRRADKAAKHDPLSGVGIGSGPEGLSSIGDLFGKLRRVSRQFRWSPQEDAELERKLAQMELCDTDQQLLEWAAREVFDESGRYEGAARQALFRAETSSTKTPSPEPELETGSTQSDSSQTIAAASSEAEAPARPSFSSPLPLQPPAYPHLLAALIRTFRDKFHDPHLALSIFQHARSRSIVSYVFGCTVPAYNELLRTRWEAFRDLRGVADALSEMRVNGIAPDAKTRSLVEELRREVGTRTVWQEERNIGTGEVLDLVNQIERLSREPLERDREQQLHQRNGEQKKKYRSKSKVWRTSTDEGWKLDDGRPDRNYRFGDWKLSSGKKRKPSTPQTQQPSQTQEFAFE